MKKVAIAGEKRPPDASQPEWNKKDSISSEMFDCGMTLGME